jgi:hypothetical protein
MKKFGLLRNYRNEGFTANASGDESTYEKYVVTSDKVLYDFETGLLFFSKKGDVIDVLPEEMAMYDEFIIPESEKERIDMLTNILDEGIPYCYTILGIS